ncbi:MAG: rhodanese-like domain-containing protein [Acidobacteriota bacterium]|jgi:rhodanese-related sulfurtransferase
MKIKAFASLILILSMLSLIDTFSTASAKDEVVLPNIPRISAEDLRQMIDKGADFVTLDVRDTGSYEAGHIKGAVNIYYDPTADPTDRQMMLIALPMDKLIVTYCDCTDDASSAKIADELYKLGYDRDKVKVLSGGSLRWVELKYPMVSKK